MNIVALSRNKTVMPATQGILVPIGWEYKFGCANFYLF